MRSIENSAPEPMGSDRVGAGETVAISGWRKLAAQVALLGAFFIDLLLYSLVVPFLPGEAEQLGASPAVTGALFAMYAAGLFAVTPLAAWLTDRVGAHQTLLWRCPRR